MSWQITVLVGTKLHAIMTKMGLKIEERGEIVKGVPLVQPGDDLFWFNRPGLMLYLINFVLFQVIKHPYSFIYHYVPARNGMN